MSVEEEHYRIEIQEDGGEEFLKQVESRLREEIKSMGFKPIEGNHIGLQYFRSGRTDIEDVQDLRAYLDSCRGDQIGDLVLFASQRGRTSYSQDAVEEVSIGLDFEPEKFCDVYSELSESVDLERIGFTMNGFGESSLEAYEAATPMLTFKVDDETDTGVAVSYRSGGMIEQVWGNEESVQDILHAMEGLSLEYDGAVRIGENEDSWIVADSGFYNLDEMA